jgi:hypothetical protein
MNPKFLYGFIGLLLIGFVGLVVVNKQTAPPRPGIAHSDKGRQHVEQKSYSTNEPPTSGDHADPIAWGVYETEQRDDQLIHNMEHGGIVVTYRPDLPQNELAQLRQLLSTPFSETGFEPKKIVIAPRKTNKAPIVLSSWQRSETLQSYDKQAIMTYTKRNLGKSPEPLAS